MVRKTPCVRAATAGESGAAGETSAEVCAASRGETASVRQDRQPRRRKRDAALPQPPARSLRALASRLESVPSTMPSRLAASLRLTPSSSQSTTTERRCSGSAAISSSRMANASTSRSGAGSSGAVRDGGHGHFAGQSAGGHGTSLPGGANGDPIQPGADGLGRANVAGAASEHRERRLEGVIREVPVAGNPAANAQDHRPEPADEVRERRFGTSAGIAAQEFAVGDVRGVRRRPIGRPSRRRRTGRGRT